MIKSNAPQKIIPEGCLVLKKNMSMLLSITSSIGVVATAIMAVNATPKALDIIDSEKKRAEKPKLSVSETVKTTWKCYLPATLTGIATIACMISSTVANRKQQTSLAAAYVAVSSAYDNYRRKNREINGESAHQAVLDAIVKEKAANKPIYASTFFEEVSLDFDADDESHRLFYDQLSDRYFESTFSHVLQAEYHLNRNFTIGGGVTLNEFYEMLGISKTDFGDSVGWSLYDGLCWIDFEHRKVVMDDGLECFIIDSVFNPCPFTDEDLYLTKSK